MHRSLNMDRAVALIAGAWLCVSQPCLGADLAFVGGLNLASQAPSATGAEAGIAPAAGGGALLRLGFIELGALYLPRGSRVTTGANFLVTSYHSLVTPLLARVQLTDIASIGAGGYWAYVLAGTASVQGTVSGVAVNQSAPISISRHDAGLMASGQLRLPVGSYYSIVADFRYVYGMLDLDASSGQALMTRDIQLLAGFSFDL
jgi:hypothetical protein